MVQTASTMLPLGSEAPDFQLLDVVTDRTVQPADFAGKPMLVQFICNHCPFVKHVRGEIAKLGEEYQQKGVAVLAISSNDAAAYPDDGPDRMREEAAAVGYMFPYLYDETQQAAKAYQAACTPDFYLFDSKHRLVYRGQLDGSRPGNHIPVTGSDLRAALEDVLAGRKPNPEQKPSIGCNIKWAPGAEPEYFKS